MSCRINQARKGNTELEKISGDFIQKKSVFDQIQEKIMKDIKIRLLLVEDDKIDQMAFERYAKNNKLPYDYTIAGSIVEAKNILKSNSFDVVISDYMLGDGVSFELFDLFKDIPVIVTTGTGSEEIAVEAMRLGAGDYLIKDPEGNYLKTLPATVKLALKRKQNEKELQNYQKNLESMVKDRTAELQAEILERKSSEERFRTIFENAPVLIDAFNTNGKCILWNYECEKTFGWTIEDLNKSVDPLSMFYPEDEVRAEVFKTVSAQPDKKFKEWYPCTKTGKILTVLWANFRVADNLVINIGYDITERKKNELELASFAAKLKYHKINLEKIVEQRTNDLSISNAKLQRANRLKDEFLANMSHELRTPLTAVLGMSEAMIDQVYGQLNEKQIKSLQLIENSGRHLLNLINDILDLSKINAGKEELQVVRVSLQEVCQASMNMVKQIAMKKKQSFSFNIDNRLTHIQADILRLKQILVNLLTNAVKFTPEHGEIRLEVNWTPHLNRVEFSVLDTGIGISKENMNKLFKPFVQVNGSFARDHGGTGLGLALVSKLIEMHGGSVKVESEEGKFSRFTINLPHYPDNDPQGFEQPDPSVKPIENLMDHKHRIRVLIADDNIENIETVSDYLKARKYDISLAYDGIQAVEMTFKVKPDIILMDIQMPAMDGLEAIKKIRSRETRLNNERPKSEIKKIPIVALTALAMPGDKEKCLVAGADKYISKPAGLKMLSETIEKLTGVKVSHKT